MTRFSILFLGSLMLAQWPIGVSYSETASKDDAKANVDLAYDQLIRYIGSQIFDGQKVPTIEQPYLWKVTKAGKEFWVLGTIHLGVDPLADFNEAYLNDFISLMAEAQRVCTEIALTTADIQDMTAMTIYWKEFTSQRFFPDENNFGLTKDQLSILSSVVRRVSMDFFVSQESSGEKCHLDDKSISHRPADFLKRLYDVDVTEHNLADISTEDGEELLNTYVLQMREKVLQYMHGKAKPNQSNDKASKELLQRNKVWLEKIEKMDLSKKTFIVAGVGHFIGEQGLISDLRN